MGSSGYLCFFYRVSTSLMDRPTLFLSTDEVTVVKRATTGRKKRMKKRKKKKLGEAVDKKIKRVDPVRRADERDASAFVGAQSCSRAVDEPIEKKSTRP